MNKSGEPSATFVPLGAVMSGRLISARARSLHLLDKIRFGPIADIRFLLTKARSRSRNACNRRAWQMSLLREARLI